MFPPLVGVLPEARLNLAIHSLKNGEFHEADKLMENVEPSQPPEYILKVSLTRRISTFIHKLNG